MFKKVAWMIRVSLRFCFPFIFLNILLSCVSPIITVAINLMNKNMINRLIADSGVGELSAAFMSMVFVYLLLYFLSSAYGWVRSGSWYFFTYKVNLFYRKLFLWRSYNIPQDKFLDSAFLDRYSYVSGDLGNISGFIDSVIKLMFFSVGTLVGTLAVFAAYEPWLILYIAVVAVCIISLYIYTSKKEYELGQTQLHEARYASSYGGILTSQENAKELRIYGFRGSVFDKWILSADKLREEKLALGIKTTKLWNLYNVTRLLFRISAVTLLLWGTYRGRYDVGTFAMLFGLVETGVSQVENLAGVVLSGTYKNIKYLGSFYDFITPITFDEMKRVNRTKFDENMDLPFGEFKELKAENIKYKYPSSDRYAVNGASLTVKRGEIVSILGYNGSGKTTFTKLLNGSLTPESGNVTLNGIPVCDGNREDIFKYFGFAPQEYSRFSIPLRDVVGIGRIDVMGDREKLELAYKKADVAPLLEKFGGEDVILGKEYDDKGINVSGGEWQKLIIASAYMGEPEVLILDEPTASIDPLKEMELIRNFRENLKGKTAILISHRIGFARLADRIVMMENGMITEEGTHEELLERGKFYPKLFHEQKKLYEEGFANEG